MTEMAKKLLDNSLIGNESLMDTIPDGDAPASADRAISMIRRQGNAFMDGTIDKDAFMHTLTTQSSVIVRAYGDCKNAIIVNTISLVVANIAGLIAMLRRGEFD